MVTKQNGAFRTWLDVVPKLEHIGK